MPAGPLCCMLLVCPICRKWSDCWHLCCAPPPAPRIVPHAMLVYLHSYCLAHVGPESHTASILPRGRWPVLAQLQKATATLKATSIKATVIELQLHHLLPDEGRPKATAELLCRQPELESHLAAALMGVLQSRDPSIYALLQCMRHHKASLLCCGRSCQRKPAYTSMSVGGVHSIIARTVT